MRSETPGRGFACSTASDENQLNALAVKSD
jgi:hypothetical protein